VVARWAARPGRAVIFDFNGTLSSDEPLLLRLYTGLFRERLGWELSAEDYYGRFAGRSDREIIEMAVAGHAEATPALVGAMLAEHGERYRGLVTEHSPVEPATRALVGFLEAHRVPTAIVTGARRRDVEFVLALSGLSGAFAVIVADEDVGRGKPHPDGFVLGAASLGVEPADVLVFEDSVHGLRAARAAGMSCIGVVGTRSRHELVAEADAVVDELDPALFTDVLGDRRGRGGT
jgi:beta-phosphoglucomutase